MTRLAALAAVGTSVWLDYISRDLLASGELARLIAEDSVTGLTSNPTIFEKAISGSALYDEAIRAAVAEGLDDDAVFERLAIADLQEAADLLRPIYEATEGVDGYVSFEVSPDIAHDTTATIAAGRRLFAAMDRPNVLIKVPATKEGVPAIQQLLYDGINVNVTLIFSVERYLEVMDAYLAALEARRWAGWKIDRIASVASFFVSRIDTAVDQLLADRNRPDLLGRAAIANAKVAYARFVERFSGTRFAELAAKGARVQRPLWASTSTKNPAYRDVRYVEELAGPHTVNTMPLATLEAFRDHGEARRAVDDNLAEAQAVLAALASEGIDLAAVTRDLEADGVRQFADSFARLRATIRAKRTAIGVRAG
ncbi:MAG: transaldolase [Dehalococcoidia bacterium]|nr:transaldolase [Dehalococcoidia bacterium]